MQGAPAAFRIGLTGGIGSGKSTVARFLSSYGAHVVDTDAIAHALTAPGGAAIEPIRAAFGSDFMDAHGALDRPRMRAAVFADPSLRHALEALLHPLIGAESERRAAASAAPVVVFDVPLLVESGHWRARVAEVWVVDCAEATQVARVIGRAAWTEAAVRAVIASQASRAARRAAADVVIDNDAASLETLAADVAASWRRLPGVPAASPAGGGARAL